MIYGSRMPPQDDMPQPPDDLPPSPDDSPPNDGPSVKTIFQIIKLVILSLGLIVKITDWSGCSSKEIEPAAIPDPAAITVAHIVTKDAVEQAFGESFTGNVNSQYCVLFDSADGSLSLVAFLATETAGKYEEENRKSGDTVQPVKGLGDEAEFILNDNTQELIVQHQQYLIVLTCMGESGKQVVDRKEELQTLGKLCCTNLNKLEDR